MPEVTSFLEIGCYVVIGVLLLLCVVVLLRPEWLGLGAVHRSSSDEMVSGHPRPPRGVINAFTEHSDQYKTIRKIPASDVPEAVREGVHLVLLARPGCGHSEILLKDMLGMDDIGFSSVLVVADVHNIEQFANTPLFEGENVGPIAGHPYMLGVKDGVGVMSILGSNKSPSVFQMMYAKTAE